MIRAMDWNRLFTLCSHSSPTHHNPSLSYSDGPLFLSPTRLSGPAPDVSHTSLPRAAHHGLLAHEHVQQGLRQHGGQPRHDHAGRHLISGRPLQDWGGGELLQPEAIWDQGGSRLSKSVTRYCSVSYNWLNQEVEFTARTSSCHKSKWMIIVGYMFFTMLILKQLGGLLVRDCPSD